jgi:hypothetical protein
MSDVTLICRNLLDTSAVVDACKKASIDVETTSRFPGEVEGIAIVDYSMVEDDFDPLRELVNKVEKAIVFGPHEKMNEMQGEMDGVTFVARSLFFHDPTKFLLD